LVVIIIIHTFAPSLTINTKTSMNRLAERLMAFRKLRGMSQKELADKSGTSVTTINHIENGGNWNRDTILKIEDALDIQLF